MNKRAGFSLMEMMIVLLIVAIVAAASAPMINKKMLSEASGKSPWVWTDGSSIAFNLKNANVSAVIGGITAPSSNPRLFVKSNDGPQITLGSGTTNINIMAGEDKNIAITGKMTPSDMYPNLTALGGNASASEDATAIGAEASALENSIALGKKASTEGDSSIAIGNNVTVKSTNNQWTGGIGIGANSYGSSVVIGKGAVCSSQGTSGGPASYAVAIGPNAKTLYNGVAVGHAAENKKTNSVTIGNNITTNGNYSTAIGSNSTTAIGNNSTALGYDAFTQANNCIAIGSEVGAGATSLYTNGSSATATSAEAAIAIGSYTLAPSPYSIAIGGNTSSDSDYSIAIGYNTFTGTPTSAPYSSKANSAPKSIAIGYQARATKENSIAIGTNVQAKHKNSIAIGNYVSASYTQTTADNQIVLGTDKHTVYIPGNLIVGKEVVLGCNDGVVYMEDDDDGEAPRKVLGNATYGFYRGVAWTKPSWLSDRRLKNVGKAFVGGLEEIKKLEVFNYTFKKDPAKTPRVGVVAQDLQKIFPDAVMKGEDGFLRIRMEDMFYALVNAVKELAAKFDLVDKRIADLEKQNQELKKQNEDLQKTLKSIEKRLSKLEK